MISELDELDSSRIVLFGGKGGVGKTTISIAAALHYAGTREVILFTTDPASNLHDFELPLRIESLDAEALYTKFLSTHLDSIVEIGDRGTYLDRDELRRLFELTMPGVDELMAWMHIGELAEQNPSAMIVVDTAPTGHTLRMLSSSDHFHQLAVALDAMQEKHRAMVRQFTRRDPRDAMDAFIEELDAQAGARRELLTEHAVFVPVTLPEPLVIEQTLRLIEEVPLEVPFVIVNRWREGTIDVGRRVVYAPRACVPLDSPERIRVWSAATAVAAFTVGEAAQAVPQPGKAVTAVTALQMVAGKGGVGKTSCSASMALQLARQNPDKNYVVISVDPAHSLPRLLTETPPNLTVEAIDTKAKWRKFRDSVGEKIVDAVDALTPRGMSLGHDTEAMRSLIEIAPPGADELFAITRLADLIADETLSGVIVDTAPTGHFLRLLDLPQAAGEWVREFMRLLLRYRDLIPAGSLGEELVRASKELKSVDAALRSDRASVIVVTRPERIVVAETKRLIENVKARGISVGAVIANYVTPEHGDDCDRSMRAHELAALAELGEAVLIERRDRPPMTPDELASLVPL
ncbi:MAG TPA: TRC40/GET3/ArsA family transport-energizing ATPase [Thermoanaerobaculia bacterium]|nr:TRC40/GET3/ArsA family transport-energizing ATPase [Thermoanaerobaculia bacterium]